MKMINSTIQQKHYATVVLSVFILALCTRIYWIHEKENLYSDELTSVCLAYNGLGWGKKTFDAKRIYKGKELRQIYYMDDRAGWQGLINDLKALHHDNRDASHASLYYMTLRLALTGMTEPSMEQLIRLSCTLNLLFFTLSFICLSLLLKETYPENSPARNAFILFWAYMNPATISNTLLAREYQMAEWLFILWTLWTVRTAKLIASHNSLQIYKRLLCGIMISAALLSCGYFNALYIGLTGISLASFTYKQRKFRELIIYPLLTSGCIILCVLIYTGFFNFLHDVRTAEVSEKIQGSDWVQNLLLTCYLGTYIGGIRILTPVWAFAFGKKIIHLSIRKREKLKFKQSRFSRIFICVWIWTAIIFFLATWKSTRYISAAIPLIMTTMAYVYLSWNSSENKKGTLVFSLLFILYSFTEYPIEHLERTTSRPWDEKAHRVMLFGPDNDEKNTLQLLIPHLKDEQECVIIETPKDISLYSDRRDKLIRIYGSPGRNELTICPDFIREENFNEFMSVYTFRNVPPAP